MSRDIVGRIEGQRYCSKMELCQGHWYESNISTFVLSSNTHTGRIASRLPRSFSDDIVEHVLGLFNPLIEMADSGIITIKQT